MFTLLLEFSFLSTWTIIYQFHSSQPLLLHYDQLHIIPNYIYPKAKGMISHFFCHSALSEHFNNACHKQVYIRKHTKIRYRMNQWKLMYFICATPFTSLGKIIYTFTSLCTILNAYIWTKIIKDDDLFSVLFPNLIKLRKAMWISSGYFILRCPWTLQGLDRKTCAGNTLVFKILRNIYLLLPYKFKFITIATYNS